MSNHIASNAIPTRVTSVLEVNKVLRNTYMLLALSLLFSAGMAGLSMAMNQKPLGLLITLGGFFLLQFGIVRFRDSGVGVALVFALTGFMGYTLGPILNMFMKMSGGSSIVMTALGATGTVFLALSAYVLMSRKDFSFMGGFLFAGIWIAFIAGLAAIFFQIPMLSLAVSAAFALISSGYILYDTSRIIHGGETNYVMATTSLFVNIYNLFLSLLQIFGVLGRDE